MKKKLYRSRTNRMVSGICGGIAEYLNIDETLVRLAAALIMLVSGVIPFVIVYFIAAIIIPEAPETYEPHA
ncbi:MAG: PspC domain-containing protein [Firmicutes bacterium]|jgi:phage shock protein C|nr:PspC domain-containing protein [Bacillota bacterium]